MVGWSRRWWDVGGLGVVAMRWRERVEEEDVVEGKVASVVASDDAEVCSLVWRVGVRCDGAVTAGVGCGQDDGDDHEGFFGVMRGLRGEAAGEGGLGGVRRVDMGIRVDRVMWITFVSAGTLPEKLFPAAGAVGQESAAGRRDETKIFGETRREL
ncbi:hypothetical protein Tco_0064092 [Tanacetum coccineum]